MTAISDKITFSILTTSLAFLTGCSPIPTEDFASSDQAPESDSVAVFLANINPDEKLISLAIDGQLRAINPHAKEMVDVYTFSDDAPSRLDLDTFHTSFNHEYVVWQQPGQGIFALDLDSGTTDLIYQPTDWFSANPFILMDDQDKLVRFIDNQGQTLYQYNLSTNQLSNSSIPFPYGTKFVRSPDNTQTIFIAGFGQSTTQPTYLYMNHQTEQAQQFTTDAEIADREALVWLPDSSGFLVIEDGTTISKYSPDLDFSPVSFANSNDGDRIVDLKKIQDLIYAQVVGGNWLIFDSQGEQINEIPYEITQGLNRARIIPWSKDVLLIEETVVDDVIEFKRLWRSDNQGFREILVPRYYPSETITPTIQATE